LAMSAHAVLMAGAVGVALGALPFDGYAIRPW
jgi:hypothetical protein